MLKIAGLHGGIYFERNVIKSATLGIIVILDMCKSVSQYISKNLCIIIEIKSNL